MSLNQYFFHRSIGKGAFAQVYEGFEYKTQTPVAIKIVKTAIQPSHLKLVEQQIQLLNNINHPHIIKMIKSLRREIIWYLILEYCPGGNLADYLKINKNLNENQILTIACSIGDALKYLQKQKIAHRDIKLENILIDSMGKVKLADLGLGKQIKDEQFMFSKAGTETTMAPEIKYNNGKTKYTIKCDVWSFGIILYEIIYGVIPFQSKKNYSQKNTKIEFPLSRIKISNQANQLIQKCLKIDPNQRISAYQIMEQPWIKRYLSKSPDLVLLKYHFNKDALKLKAKQFASKDIYQELIYEYNNSIARSYESFKIQNKQDLIFFRSNFDYALGQIKHYKNQRITQLFYQLISVKISSVQKIHIKFIIHAKILTKVIQNHQINQRTNLIIDKIKRELDKDPLIRGERFQIHKYFTIEQQLIYLLLRQGQATTNNNLYQQLWKLIGVIVTIIQSNMNNYTIKLQYDSEISEEIINKIENSKRNFNKSHLDNIVKNRQQIPIRKVDLFNWKINQNQSKQDTSYFNKEILKMLKQTSVWF